MIDVLIVEDSSVTRQNLKRILEADPEIKVIGMAANGIDAINFVQEQRPEVITMDINMPKMNGMEATRHIMENYPVPIVIVSASYNSSDVEKSFRAMEAGAVAILEKPFGEGHPGYAELAETLVRTVKLMSEVKVIRRWPKISKPRPEPAFDVKAAQAPDRVRLVAIGASTGGPPVLQTILSGLTPDFPVPIMIVQHIAKGFLEGLCEWLAHTTGHTVRIATDNEKLKPGAVYLAPDDHHLGISNGLIKLSNAEPLNGIRPSISYLFRSAMENYGAEAIGVLLTGMGKDGAMELKDMKDMGAVTIAQDKESSVVFGMPGEAVKLDAATYVLPADNIPAALQTFIKNLRRA